MIKKLLSAAAVAGCVWLPLSAATAVTHGEDSVAKVLDVRSRLEQSNFYDTAKHLPSKDANDNAGEVKYASLIVSYTDDEALDNIRALGGRILYTRGGMALTFIPRDKVSVAVRDNYVDGARLGRRLTRNTNVSRAVTQIQQLQDGTDSYPTGLDGTGVVAGICDTGVDPQHIAFGNRIGMMSVIVDSLGIHNVYAPGTPLDNGGELVTDTQDETHGTHVLNILGGSYKGNPYYGGAPGATLAVSCSYLTDVAMLTGIEDIIAYARAVGKPAVINMSVGEQLGPHDGTDLINRYLDLVGREALICLSAGNSGDQKYSLQHTLGPDSPGRDGDMLTVGSVFESGVLYNGRKIDGAFDLWSADQRMFDIRFCAYDLIENRKIWTGGWFGPRASSPSSIQQWQNTEAVADGSFTLTAADLPELADKFNVLRIAGAWGIDAQNGRYVLMCDYNLKTDINQPGHTWSRYIIGWDIRGAEGTEINGFTDGITSFFQWYGREDKIGGNALQSISNLCCGQSVLSVGSWNQRNQVPVLGSDTEAVRNFEINRHTEWSSYGTLRDGRVLPEICAPGNTVISAMSGHFHNSHPQAARAFAEVVNGTEYSWYEECGTSMASPAAAAVLALWTQVYPELTIRQAKEIAMRTANRNFPDMDDPHWGASGAIDAKAGLAEVLKLNSVGNIQAAPQTTVWIEGSRIMAVGHAAAYDISGHPVQLGTPLPAGIYIVKTPESSRKIYVK